MRIGNRIFPYPTLNNNTQLSEYDENSSFELTLTTTEKGELIIEQEQVVLRDIHFILENDGLKELYYDNKLKCALIVECSSSLFRNVTHITDTPVDITFPICNLSEHVFVSAYLYASEDLENYKNDKFIEDYDNYKFDIEKYDILAIDDGFKFRIDIDPDKDNKVDSIFTIVKRDSNEQQMEYLSDTNKIIIYLSPEYYGYYESVKADSTLNNVIFAILLIPTLVACLNELKLNIDDDSDMEDVIEQKRWFKSICLSYEKATSSALTLEEFKESDTLKLAQIVLNNATCNGLGDFTNILINGTGGSSEDDEN